jgi:hypothetical protein
MPESVVLEELEALDILFQGVMQLRSGRRDQDTAKDRPFTPTSLYQWREGPRFPRCDLSPISAVCECRWSRTWLPRARCNANAAGASGTRSVTADTCPGASLEVAPTSPVGAQPRGNSLSAVPSVANTASYRGCVKWKEAKAAFVKRAPEGVRKSAATSPTQSTTGRSICRADGSGRGLELRRPRGACCQGHPHSTKS